MRMEYPRPPRCRANFTPRRMASGPRTLVRAESVRIVSRYREFTTVTERIHLFHLHLLSTLMPYSSSRVAGSFFFYPERRTTYENYGLASSTLHLLKRTRSAISRSRDIVSGGREKKIRTRGIL